MTAPLPSLSHPARRVVLTALTLVVLVALLVVAAGATFSAASAEPAPGRGVWPLQPRPPVEAGFDPPTTRWGSGHRGVDLGGHVGEAVHAALAGRISFAGRLAGRGVVVVDHGATRTTYEPVEASVHVGDLVTTSAVIGRLQLFGSHCFPRACLHWGLIEGVDHYLDPLTLVGAAPVRLLPLTGGIAPWSPSVPSSPGLASPLAPSPARPELGPEGVPGRLRFGWSVAVAA